ncbi:MAG: hypothetical protein GF311_14600 [Candidatus Lokiarchaeota archaeon]|nr:hypothetical protein [Candidatus Lokiarchaeota archaeon]
MLILGLDIGGANTKAALLKFSNRQLIASYPFIEYFPFWEKTKDHITTLFQRIISNLINANGFNIADIDHVAVTMTAELSDAFQTKEEGIRTILDALSENFEEEALSFITIHNKYIPYKTAKKSPKLLAAANWVSTALYLGLFEPNCILIDAGSTTIDIIPISDSFPKSKGKTDIERLMHHELIYTGGLRATIPSITHYIPYQENKLRISFEKFALISDVHRILNNITEEQYINDTADNRSKSLEDCYARLARIICADLTMISKNELNKIANYIYQKQKDIIKEEIKEFIENTDLEDSGTNVMQNIFVLTGLSSEFLIKPVLEELGCKNIRDLELITSIPDSINSSAFAVAGAFYYRHILKNDEV